MADQFIAEFLSRWNSSHSCQIITSDGINVITFQFNIKVIIEIIEGHSSLNNVGILANLMNIYCCFVRFIINFTNNFL
ncbi:Uncharacterised protein [Streptococcus pneumoniae]|nr:Uncharacterised protein [Streptococcus pneumoniae]